MDTSLHSRDERTVPTVDCSRRTALKKAKTVKSAGKVMATFFWDARGTIFIYYVEKGQKKAELNSSAMLFQYGPPDGRVDVRQQVARYLMEMYNDKVKSEDLIVTTGATQGLHVILSTLLELNGFIFVDEVTYFVALDVFRQFTSIQVLPVKLNSNGVNIESLRAKLKENRFEPRSKSYWGMYYTIPTYHNPTGITFADDICKQLIHIAREFDILIVCDDVYNILCYEDGALPKRLYAYDDPHDDTFMGNVISNGSFSKIVSPGIRLGWIEAPPRCKEILENSGILRSGGCLNNYTSGIIASLIELGLAQQHTNFAKGLYRERMLAAVDVLKTNLPKSCTFIQPGGGYFIWVEMPEETSAGEFLTMCLEKYKVFFLTGDEFSLEKKFKNCFRISISFHEKDVVINAVEKICEALKEYLSKG